MPQTTDGMSFADAKIEISANGTTWTDISGFSNSVEVDGGDRSLGEIFTAEGDTPIITKGKRASMNVKMKIVYTEGASDPQEVVRADYESGTRMYVRWSPKGGGSGAFMYTADPGYIESFSYPVADVGSGDTILTEFSVKVAKITKSVVAP